jgi:ABC-type sugar transport system ATPase subunit
VDLSKAYPGVQAVDGVSLRLEPGQIVGLVGKNGAGKSTLLKILAGSVHPDAGRILLRGRPVVFRNPAESQRAGLAFLHQELNLVEDLTVAENIALGWGYPRRGFFLDRSKLFARAREVMEQIGLGDVNPRAMPGTLSTARQRVIMIARALWGNASFLILDEPTGALTQSEIADLHSVVRQLAAAGTGIVYVSHRLDEVIALAERIIVMRDGRLTADLTAADIDKRQLILTLAGAEGDTELEAAAHDAQAHHASAVASESGVSLPRDTVPLLAVEDLGSRHLGVSGVSFGVDRGEVVGIAGLVGSGRSELLRLVFGADAADTGVVRVHGEIVPRPTPGRMARLGVALLGEERARDGIIPDASVRTNLTLACLKRCRRGRLPSPAPAKEARITDSMIEELSIKTPAQSTLITNLSGGNQQKVLLARWLAHGADVLLLDEPTVGVDVLGKGDFYRQVRAVADAGHGVVFVSSEHEELVAVCDRAVVMREGTVVGELKGAQLTESGILDLCYDHREAAPVAP